MPSNQYEPPSDDSDLEDDTTLTLKEFWQHQKKVAAGDKLSFLLMVGRGVHSQLPPVKDITEVPILKEALLAKGGGLNKSKLTFTKAMVVQELVRRCPEKKDSGFNAKNKNLDQLLKMLVEDHPLTDDDDILFVQQTIDMHFTRLRNAINEKEAATAVVAQRISSKYSIAAVYCIPICFCSILSHMFWLLSSLPLSSTEDDRLRYICMIEDPTIGVALREAFARLQDVQSRQQLDARNSEMAPPNFHDLAVAKFNDVDYVPVTRALPDLHPDLAIAKALPKRPEYDMTEEKSKALVATMRQELLKIIRKYNLSGSGADQVSEDSQSYGHVDLDKVIQEKGSDDRGNFLGAGQPVDVLYWWDVLDSAGLVHFTTALLTGDNAANSDSVPSVTSYQSRKKPRTGDNAMDAQIAAQMQALGKSLDDMNKIGREQLSRDTVKQLTIIEEKLLDARLKLLTSTDESAKPILEAYVKKLEAKVDLLEADYDLFSESSDEVIQDSDGHAYPASAYDSV